MASAYWDKVADQLIIDFRPLYGRGKRRRVRVAKSCRDIDTARLIADRAENLCRLLETTPTQALIDEALACEAITDAQASTLRGEQPQRPQPPETSILGCWERHPSTVRERERDQHEWQRHFAAVQAFITGTSIADIHDLTLDAAQAWIASRRAQGAAWDTRRHALLCLRRAAVMGATLGYPNRIGSLKIDRRERQQPIAVVPLTALLAAYDRSPYPLRIAIALCGFMGLRCSEAARAQARDITGDILSIGARQAKNQPSIRDLVIPSPILADINAHLAGQPSSAPLVPNTAGAPYRHDQLGRVLRPWLAAVGCDLPGKALRKSFASWAIEHLDPFHLEHYLGHESSLVSLVTDRHYLARLRADRLRPTADRIAAIITDHPRARINLRTPAVTQANKPSTETFTHNA